VGVQEHVREVARPGKKGREGVYPCDVTVRLGPGGSLPDISSISTCEASSLDLSVAEIDSAVTPEVFASVAAWVSGGAAIVKRVVEKGREVRVTVDEIGLDSLTAVRKTEARASIGRASRRAKGSITKDV
jgi:hypothetical protein